MGTEQPNFISFEPEPEAFFFVPGRDPGMAFLQSPDWIWRTHETAAITGVPLSAHDEINEHIAGQVRRTRTMRQFEKLIEFNTVPVVLENVRFAKSFVSVGGKWLLNGASGTRLRNSYTWKHPDPDNEIEDRSIAFFDDCQAKAGARPLQTTNEDIRDLDFAIECRNTFNYYHFVTETLCQLCTLDGLDHRGRIFIHYPNKTPSGFVMGFIRALFPELADRVTLARTPARYDKVLSAFNLRHYYYQTSDAEVASVDEFAPKGWVWRGRTAQRNSQSLLWQNAVDTNLIRLRERALRIVADHDASHLPRRFWVARSSDGARQRQMHGEEALTTLLRGYGFETLVFEELEPIEQIAAMANAEIMISYHGAGFTNMLFAAPDAHVIELGTLQTALYRWGDFQPHAHVAGCAYTSFFADHHADDPLKTPDFTVDGIVPVALPNERIATIVSFVATLLGRSGPNLPAHEVGTLVHSLWQAGLPQEARRVIDANAALIGKDFDLTITLGELCIETEDFAAALEAFGKAHALEPDRYRLLQRMVWLARKSGQEGEIPAILATLQDRFPDRYAAFEKKINWYSGPRP